MSTWLLEKLYVLGYSRRAQAALVLGLLFWAGFLMLGAALEESIALPGLFAPLNDVLRLHIEQRASHAAWATLFGFAVVAFKAYRRDRRRLLGD
jgi:hypothetical protein